MNIIRSHKYRTSIRLITFIVTTAFLCQNISWASEKINRECLAARSKIQLFFSKNNIVLTSPQEMALSMTMGQLQKSILEDKKSDIAEEIQKLNTSLSNVGIEIITNNVEIDSESGIPHVTIAINNSKNSFRAYFLKEDQRKVNKRLVIEEKDLRHFDCPGLEGVWFVNTDKMVLPERSTPQCLTEDGFVDVPRIIAEGRVQELFLNLFPEVEEIRAKDFPLLMDKRIYLDNGATTQEPRSVRKAYENWRDSRIRGSNHSWNSNEARQAQQDFDKCKNTLARFLGAHDYHIAITSGVTESSNIFATRFDYQPGDLMLITSMEHNSEIITARNYAKYFGAEVAYVPVTSQGALDLNALKEIVASSTHKRIIMNLVHVSNVTGASNSTQEIRRILGDRGVIYLDMAQSAAHMPINLDELGVDFAGLSAHKMYGPFGLGALFVKKGSEHLLNNRVLGGGAVDFVTPDYEMPLEDPTRFELGTRNLEGAYEWKLALEWLERIGLERAAAHERELGRYFAAELAKIEGVDILGEVDVIEGTGNVISFNIGGHKRMMHAKVARRLNELGIIVRNSCFCAHIYTSCLTGTAQYSQVRAEEFVRDGHSKDVHGYDIVPGAARVVFAVYNTLLEAYTAVQAVRQIADEMMNRPVDVNMAWITYVNDQKRLFRDPIDPRDVYQTGEGQYSHPALYPVTLTNDSFVCGDKIYDDLGLVSQAFRAFESGFKNGVTVDGHLKNIYDAGVSARQRWRKLDLGQEDGAIIQGTEAKKEFDANRAAGKYKLLRETHSDLLSVVQRVFREINIPLVDIPIYGISSIVKGKKDFIHGYFDRGTNELFLSINIMNQAKAYDDKHGTKLLDEYIEHELRCRGENHQELRREQRDKYLKYGNYKDINDEGRLRDIIMFLAGEMLLSHKRNNEYIERKIKEIGYDNLLREIVPIKGVESNAELIAIPDLLKFTGLPAHVGLGRYYGKPVIYIDRDLYYNEDIRQHEFDEVSKWEELRNLIRLKPEEMRKWILDNIETPFNDERLPLEYRNKTSRQIAEIIHGRSHRIPKELYKRYTNTIDYEYLAALTMYDGEYVEYKKDFTIAAKVAEEEGTDGHIAAQNKNAVEKVERLLNSLETLDVFQKTQGSITFEDSEREKRFLSDLQGLLTILRTSLGKVDGKHAAARLSDILVGNLKKVRNAHYFSTSIRKESIRALNVIIPYLDHDQQIRILNEASALTSIVAKSEIEDILQMIIDNMPYSQRLLIGLAVNLKLGGLLFCSSWPSAREDSRPLAIRLLEKDMRDCYPLVRGLITTQLFTDEAGMIDVVRNWQKQTGVALEAHIRGLEQNLKELCGQDWANLRGQRGWSLESHHSTGGPVYTYKVSPSDLNRLQEEGSQLASRRSSVEAKLKRLRGELSEDERKILRLYMRYAIASIDVHKLRKWLNRYPGLDSSLREQLESLVTELSDDKVATAERVGDVRLAVMQRILGNISGAEKLKLTELDIYLESLADALYDIACRSLFPEEDVAPCEANRARILRVAASMAKSVMASGFLQDVLSASAEKMEDMSDKTDLNRTDYDELDRIADEVGSRRINLLGDLHKNYDGVAAGIAAVCGHQTRGVENIVENVMVPPTLARLDNALQKLKNIFAQAQNDVTESQPTYQVAEVPARPSNPNILFLEDITNDTPLYGNKAINLHRMITFGLPVPPGFVISSRMLKEGPSIRRDLLQYLKPYIRALEAATGKKFGDRNNPLYLAVRSSPPESMPGLLATELEVATEDHLIKALLKVKGSWRYGKARKYREIHDISHDTGMAIVVQVMKHGDLNKRSASGVAFTMDPITGRGGLSGRFVVQKQGKDIVSRTVIKTLLIWELRSKFPNAYKKLLIVKDRLEREYKRVQEIEFVIENNRLWVVQARNATLSATAEFNTALYFLQTGLIDQGEMAARIKDAGRKKIYKIENSFFLRIHSPYLLGSGQGVSPGVAWGPIAFSLKAAKKYHRQGRPAILVALEMHEEIIEAILSGMISGIVTDYGHEALHEAVLARAFVLPMIDGELETFIQKGNVRTWSKYKPYMKGNSLIIGGRTLPEGTEIVMDAQPHARIYVKDKAIIITEVGMAEVVDIGFNYQGEMDAAHRAFEQFSYKNLLYIHRDMVRRLGERLDESIDAETLRLNITTHAVHLLIHEKGAALNKTPADIAKDIYASNQNYTPPRDGNYMIRSKEAAKKIGIKRVFIREDGVELDFLPSGSYKESWYGKRQHYIAAHRQLVELLRTCSFVDPSDIEVTEYLESDPMPHGHPSSNDFLNFFLNVKIKWKNKTVAERFEYVNDIINKLAELYTSSKSAALKRSPAKGIARGNKGSGFITKPTDLTGMAFERLQINRKENKYKMLDKVNEDFWQEVQRVARENSISIDGISVYAIESIVKAQNDFVHGYFDRSTKELFLSINIMQQAQAYDKGHGTKTLDEYIEHELRCEGSNHQELRKQQRQKYYKIGNYKDEITDEGRLRDIIREDIDMRVKAGELVKTMIDIDLEKNSDERIILGFDTNIGNIKDMPDVGLFLEQVKSAVKNLGNIDFFMKAGIEETDIEAQIGNLTSKGISRDKIRVVLVTDKEDGLSDYNVTRIDDSSVSIVNGDYIPIIEILAFALKAHITRQSEEIDEELKELYRDITGSEIGKDMDLRRIILVLPQIKKITIDIYKTANEILTAT